MNKQILLLEDRPYRQSQYLDERAIDKLQKIRNLTFPKGNECDKWIENINNNFFSQNLEYFDLIIIHRSALNEDGKKNIIEFCKRKKKSLVFFSGEISQSIYTEIEFPYLLLSTKDFYQPHLTDFFIKLSNGELEHLTELIYGQRWKLNAMLGYRQLLLKGDLSRIEEKLKDGFESIIGGGKKLAELEKEIKKYINLL